MGCQSVIDSGWSIAIYIGLSSFDPHRGREDSPPEFNEGMEDSYDGVVNVRCTSGGQI